MLRNEAFSKLLSMADSADRILDFAADQSDAPIEFASMVTRGLSDVLSTAAEQARMYEFFQLDPEEIQIFTQLASKHAAKSWQRYLQGLIYVAAKRAEVPADNLIELPNWINHEMWEGEWVSTEESIRKFRSIGLLDATKEAKAAKAKANAEGKTKAVRS